MRQMEIVRLGFTRHSRSRAGVGAKHNPASPSTAQGQPVYRFARTAVDGRALLRRVINVAMDSKGRVYVATRQSVP